jgi:hypothetical protein
MADPVKDPAQNPNPADPNAAAAAAAAPANPADAAAGKQTPAADGAAKAEGGADGKSLLDQASDDTRKAEEKRLLETPEDQLNDTDKVKRADLIKAQQEAAKGQVPEKYEIKVPDGMTLDQGLLDTLTPVFKELKLTQEGAQKLADAYAPALKAMAEKTLADAKAQEDQNFQKFVQERKDETIKALGANYKEQMSYAARARDRFASKELREKLELSGLSNDIDVIKLFIDLGRAISEGKFVDGKPENPGNANPVKTLFPSASDSK